MSLTFTIPQESMTQPAVGLPGTGEPFDIRCECSTCGARPLVSASSLSAAKAGGCTVCGTLELRPLVVQE